VQIIYSLFVLQVNESKARPDNVTASAAIATLIANLNQTHGTSTCFFNHVNYTVSGTAKDVQSTNGGGPNSFSSTNNSSGGGGMAQYYAIAGVAGVLLLLLIILVAMRRRRRSGEDGGFALGAANGAAAADFANPMFKARARGVGFDCPIYDEFDVDDDGDDEGLMPPGSTTLPHQNSLLWDDLA
jgi:hypothetical protein